MLKPDYFEGKEAELLEIYGDLEGYILQDLAKRLLMAETVSATADYELWKLKQMGLQQQEIEQKLQALTKLSRKELRKILQDAVLTSWKDDKATFKLLGKDISNPLENAFVVSIMDAEYHTALKQLDNLTRTTMKKSQQDLIDLLSEVDMLVASGTKSYAWAVNEVLTRYAKGGIMVEYPTGAKLSLESAVRLCVVTSMNQTSAQVTNQYIKEGNIEYVLVSAHLGARPQGKNQPYLAGHDNWQGKVYKINGSDEDAPNLLEKTGYNIDKNGVGHVVNPLGLHGYNCRHSHQPWDKSLRNPWIDENGKPIIDKEESKKVYEKQQKARSMEREIRKNKRILNAKKGLLSGIAETDVRNILEEEINALKAKIAMQNKIYKAYCAENDFNIQYDRLKVKA